MKIKGYYVSSGYMGLVQGKYILFASESEYYEYVEGVNGNDYLQ